jgi:hypothetical protein
VLAHRNISAAPLDVVEVRDLPRRVVVHPSSPPSCVGRWDRDRNRGQPLA